MPPQRQHKTLDHASSSSDSVYDGGDLDDDELLQLSSSDSSAGPSPVIPKLTINSVGDGVDEISKDLAELEELRKSVQKNLRLRPIRSKGRLPKVNLDEMGVRMPGAFPLSAKLKEEFDVQSPVTPAEPQTPMVGPAVVAVAATALAYVSGGQETALATVTGEMAVDGSAVDGLHLYPTSTDSASSSVDTSTSTTPTRYKPKLKAKAKGPPPALVLQDPHTRNSNPTSSTQPLQHDTSDDIADGELIIPPRPPFSQSTPSLSVTIQTPVSAMSPTSSILSSYFTPAGDTPITSRFIGAYYASPIRTSMKPADPELDPEQSSSPDTTTTVPTPTEPSSSTASSFTMSTSSIPDITSINQVARPIGGQPQPIPASDLYSRLATESSDTKSRPRPLVIDTRAPAAYVAYRIRGSVNIAIPSLILKRCRKATASGILRGGDSSLNPSPNVGAPGTGGGKGGFQNMEALRQFLVGERAKEEWSVMLKSLHKSDEEVEDRNLVWDGDVIVYDEEMVQDVAGTAWILMEVLIPLVTRHGGRVDYLEGGIMKGVKDTRLERLVEFGPIVSNTEEEEPRVISGAKKSSTGGLFQLDTKKKLPDIEASSSSTSTTLPSNSASPVPPSILRSSLSTIPSSPSANTSMSNTSSDTTMTLMPIPVHVISEASHDIDSAPSPPPSSLTFRHNKSSPPTLFTGGGLRAKRPSVPNLRRIDTKSAERLNPNLPKLSVKTKPTRSATLTIPPRLTLPGSNGSLQPPASPSHLNLVYSSHSPPASARYGGSFGDGGNGSFGLTPYYTPPHTPGTPKAFSSFQGPFGGGGAVSAYPSTHAGGGSHSHFFGYGPGPSSNTGVGGQSLDRDREKDRGYPPSPSTARPEPPSTESEVMPSFAISTILPNFLFLGPELTEAGHVEELKELGVKRILNIAIECGEDDHGLKLKDRFERYVKIPMRDTVEEENILKGVREVCEILDDARLHSAPTYVHCKAGKSRSVTAVMAYLIHANHWTLSRAYAFVLERRKGISPNIGFVSELMNFEEQELGGKSIGVQSSSIGGENGEGGNGPGEDSLTFVGMGLRRGGHIRESLPPFETFSSAAAAAVNGENGGPGGGGGIGLGGPMSAGGMQLQRVLVGDQAQEMEVKDANGRYRHARRAPVDENTLQPLRRVSKAGLESSVFEEVPRGERERERDREKGSGGNKV
ncbi:hypothetical protein P691DRAFT_808116 [Macrolepiota fuliginosa MF-IS2]|uniref:protein-tyrosine-phosphatase n=1 Tax=Macrolepiota fuliginosa MF-IS2 TaxID=1400762 RepID=A0A9P6C7P3_9AGAR|nr:hypothetical protein P691DRAFT_808116 [Macrolepiota fuliginosa MF-IS2]